MSVGYQSFYQAQLTAGITDTDTTIPLDVVPTVSEGFLVIESTVTSKREIIYFTSKTGNSVVCPSGAGNGRGYDGTTAVSHLQGAVVIMAPVGAMFNELRQQFTTTPQGWTNMAQSVTSVVANGNNSYDLTFDASVASTLSEGMRLRTTRTVATTATCFSLNGTNQYLNKTSPAGMTFTDDFTVSAWVYLTSYQQASIASRFNGTSGWYFFLNVSGQVNLIGYNGGSGNYSTVVSSQSVPLNKWVHVAAQLDMSAFTATTTTSYVMINGKDVPASVARAGTNPTALIQAGNLEIGSLNGGTSPFPGYIKDGCIYGNKVTQANILSRMHQTPLGTETDLISAYSGANTTDLNTSNANNLTAQNSAVSGFASAPYGNRGVSTTQDFALVMNVSGSTVTVQVPEGCTIPTTGGISAVSYSTQANPFGWPSESRFAISVYDKTIANKLADVGVATPVDNIKTSMAGCYNVLITQNGYTKTISGYTNVTANPTIITFPLTFSQTPVLVAGVASASSANAFAVQPTNATTTQANFRTLNDSGAVVTSETVSWIVTGV